MNIPRYFLAVTIVLAASAFATLNLPRQFEELLIRGKMAFTMPRGFFDTKVVANKQMNYEYALEYPDKNFELRLAIRPLDELLKQYKADLKNKKKSDAAVDPNTIYEATFQAIVMNISGGHQSEITTFRKDEVSIEYNADWGATTMVEVGSEFGPNYKYCIIIALHKNNVADAYYFFLAGNKEAYTYLMQPAAYCLRFK
jgi:hypothetical protein